MLIEGKKAKANRVVLDAAGTRIMILIIQISTLVGEVRHQAATPEYWGQQVRSGEAQIDSLQRVPK